MVLSEKEEYSYSMLAKLLIVFLIVHLLAVITLILMFSADHEIASSVNAPSSSVWCTGSDLAQRRCYFKNLCYNHRQQDFVFVHGNDSQISGVPESLPRSALADLSGGVEGHGNVGLYFNFVDLPAGAVGKLNLTSTILPDRLLIFMRFKPDNLMHVIHDDLLPLYFTLQELEQSGARDYRIFFADDYDEGPFWSLYRIFRSKSFLNSHHPLLRSNIRLESRGDYDADLICFSTARVGGVTNTRWYQYGFGRYQGALDVSKMDINGQQIRAFTSWVRKGLEVAKYDIDMPRFTARTRQKTPYAILFTRKANRKITNEEDVALAVSREFHLKTITVDLESQSVAEIIYLLHNCTLLIGMHGAELSLALFLPPHAILIELFPYAVPPENYTPYRTLTNIPGMKLIYRAWKNEFIERSKTHPEYAEMLGGIVSFTTSQQKQIIEDVPVKPHFCCRSPSFLYRIYQDTDVHLPSLIRTIQDAIRERNVTLAALQPTKMAASDPKNVTCTFDRVREIFVFEWTEPWNLAMLGNDTTVKYEVRIQEEGSPNYLPYFSDRNYTEIVLEAGKKQFYAWVLCWRDQSPGLISKLPGVCSRN